MLQDFQRLSFHTLPKSTFHHHQVKKAFYLEAKAPIDERNASYFV